jgi:cleavage stimulation factor subunit 2
MTNPDTGKPKGFGFADYADADSAASAVRNLNDYEVNGRKIRVDRPHNNEKDSVPTNYDQSGPVLDGANGSIPLNTLPPLPQGVDLPPNLTCADAISNTLKSLTTPQLLDVLTQMKSLAISEPQRATELLRSAPQLSYAVFQALILMNLVDPKVLAGIVEQAAPRQQQPLPPMPQPTPQQYPGYPPPPLPGQMPPRPPQGYSLPPPPQQIPPPQPIPNPAQQAQMSQEEMLRQVLAMDQRTIDSLPPVERSQIMQLRQQMGVR